MIIPVGIGGKFKLEKRKWKVNNIENNKYFCKSMDSLEEERVFTREEMEKIFNK